VTDLFGSEPLEQKDAFEKLYAVYVLYFDEEKGHIPLIIYPLDLEKLKDNKRFMRPIKYHSIWFMPVEEQAALDHIDLEYHRYIFFGKKFLTKSKREKRRAGLVEETPETIVIIVSLPSDIAIFGDEYIRLMTKEIKEKFDDKLFKIIESEIAKEQIVKTNQIKEVIKEGTKIKKDLSDLIAILSKEYFSNAIKRSDTTSIKQQKALSYLSLKGIDVSHLNSSSEDTFSKIKIFDVGQKNKEPLKIEKPNWIFNVNVAEDSQELEILVLNNFDKEFNNLSVKITHVKEFFEQEIMNQTIDVWYPKEELVFISPIIPYIKEYFFFIFNAKNEQLISKRINVNI